MALFPLDDTRLEGGTYFGDPRPSSGPCGVGSIAFQDGTYGRLDADARWELKEGSIELFTWLDPSMDQLETDRRHPLLSRDSTTQNQVSQGHLIILIYIDPDNSAPLLVMRTQRDGPEPRATLRCAPLRSDHFGRWLRLGFNFGAQAEPELFLEGQPQNALGERVLGLRCGQTEYLGGIDGNTNPWFIGETAFCDPEGATSPSAACPPKEPFVGRIDHLHLRKSRRAFGDL